MQNCVDLSFLVTKTTSNTHGLQDGRMTPAPSIFLISVFCTTNSLGDVHHRATLMGQWPSTLIQCTLCRAWPRACSAGAKTSQFCMSRAHRCSTSITKRPMSTLPTMPLMSTAVAAATGSQLSVLW